MGDDTEPRLLLLVSPSDYVRERTRLAKLARAAGDREHATFLSSLKKPPSLALWAVLAAVVSDDDRGASVRAVVQATSSLADVQGAGADRQQVRAMTGTRRAAIDTMVNAARRELARWGAGADARRAEIAALVDRLSRRPALADAWISGTLRDVPDEALGFTMFDAVTVPDRPPRAVRPASPAKTARLAVPSDVDEPSNARQEARAEVEAAGAAVEALDERLQAAERSLADAQRAVRMLRDQRAAAERRHRDAAGALARLDRTR